MGAYLRIAWAKSPPTPPWTYTRAMTHSITLVLNDPSAEYHVQATIQKLSVRLAEDEVQADKPIDSDQGPGTWTFWFPGEQGTAGVEKLLDEIDAGWRQYLGVVRLAD